MIENLQDKVYQLDNKQAKGAKLRVTLGRSWRAKTLQNVLQMLERENMQNKSIFELYTDDNK